MSRFTRVVIFATALAACTATAKLPPTPEQTTPPEETTSPDQTGPPAEPTNSHGLKLSDARDAVSKLRLGMSRRDVKKLLGLPDQTAATSFGGHVGWKRWEGLEWTYEWESPEAGVSRFFIVFKGDYSTAPISHFYWRHDS